MFDDYAFHQGSHGDYTRRINNEIEEIKKFYDQNMFTKTEAMDELVDLTDRVKNAIKNGNNQRINDLIF
ncbi:AHH domain-containing protein [Dokdonia pacifica]|nr:AHH domain-containing protein [Dokdonia pacifica]SNS36072.1 A nuclease family of the HNH/ENDO VII superfamily with conserved AHH [Dokdonia pacifica]